MAKENLSGRRKQYGLKVAEDFPETLEFPGFTKRLSLRYGINPGGPAAFYAEDGATGPNMANFEVLQEGSKGLGYINVADMDLGQRITRLLHNDYPEQVNYCIIKHEMPSGVGLGMVVEDAFYNAWDSDPLSSFGGVHASSKEINKKVATELVDSKKNVEVIYAPSFSRVALDTLSERKSLRVVRSDYNLNTPSRDNGLEYKRTEGGMLVQPKWETRIHTPHDVECISKNQPSEGDLEAALLSWKVAGFTRSNAVVIGTRNKIHGIGSGQRSRIDAAYDAIRIANGRDGTNKSFGSQETFMASDAYMPHTDVVELAAKSGVRGIIFPLGSVNDEKVIDVANKKGLVLLATRAQGQQDSERCFTH